MFLGGSSGLRSGWINTKHQCGLEGTVDFRNILPLNPVSRDFCLALVLTHTHLKSYNPRNDM